MENLLFPFCSVPPLTQAQNFNKRAVSFSSGSQKGEDGSVRDLVFTLPSPSLFASGQQGPVQGRDAFSRIPCPTMEPGQCHTTHSDPTSRRTAFRVGPLCSISLPHRGYVSNSPGPACTVPGGLARASQAVSLAPEDYQTRLRDSVRPASPQVQGHSVHLKSNQIKSLLLSHHHSTSALVSEILMSVLQTVQKNNRQFTYGQTVQKNNNRQFTYGQTVQKTALEHLQCSRQCKKKTTTAIYIWTDSAKKQQQFTYGQYIFTDCTEDNVQNTHTYTQYT